MRSATGVLGSASTAMVVPDWVVLSSKEMRTEMDKVDSDGAIWHERIADTDRALEKMFRAGRSCFDSADVLRFLRISAPC